MKWRMFLVQPHRLKTRTCLTRMVMRLMRRTRMERSAPSNQQRSRSSERRHFPGSCLERCADVLGNINLAPDTGFTDAVLHPVGMDVAVVTNHDRHWCFCRLKMCSTVTRLWFLKRGLKSCVFVWVPNWIFLTLSFLLNIKRCEHFLPVWKVK